MDRFYLVNEALTKIVQMLSSEGEFDEISKDVIALAGECVGSDNAVLLQLNEESGRVLKIAEWSVGKLHMPNDFPMEYKIFGKETVVINNEFTYADYKDELKYAGVKKMIVSPIEINGEMAMYLMFSFNDNFKGFSSSDMTFIKNVSVVLQAVIQKKVIDNSLICSYNALQDVLNNVGCEVTVYDHVTGEIQFENKMAREDKIAQSIVDESAKWYFVEKQKGNYTPDVIEKYSAKTGQWFELQFSTLTWIDNREVTMCTVFDITQKKKIMERIQFQAENDYLTGLYNRMKCEADIKALLQEVEDTNEKAAVMFLDLDDFKHINDGLGHQYGDVLLQEIAMGLQNIPGLKGNCYRMGGDEFVILLVPEVYADKEQVFENILLMFNKPWFIMETEYYCTMSMGIVELPTQGKSVNELIKKADIAMYCAKKAGKNRYVFYEESGENASVKRLDVEHNMRQAVEAECEEFVVHYQPIMDIRENKVVSCEALVRWNSKAFGLMQPGDFIPLAEYLGLITYIGDYVLETACIQCKKWNDEYNPDFRISINLSVVQLMQNNIVETIGDIVKRTGVNPKNIILEITETLAINDMDRIVKIVDGIKALGISIALDDFGTGYSSLNYIKDLKLDIIKVDRTFVEDITDEDYELVFIKLIADLSKSLGVKVCIEGVERPEQVKVLKKADVDWFQGFYYSKPISAEDFEKRYL